MVARVIRPVWRPETDEHRRLVAAAVRAAKAVADAEAALWAALAAGRDGGVPVTYLVDKTGVPRATVYRHLPKETDNGASTGPDEA
jgi:hypothetical protein